MIQKCEYILFFLTEMTDCTSKIRIFFFVGPFPIHIWVLNFLVDCNYGMPTMLIAQCRQSWLKNLIEFLTVDPLNLTYIVNFLVLTIFRGQL